jgi:hypothetical protein
MRRSTCFAFSGLSLALATSSALAGRPFATEDAEVLDLHACEWENVGTLVRERPDEGPATSRFVTTQVGCAVRPGTQLARESETGTSFTLQYAWLRWHEKRAGLRIQQAFVGLVASKPLGQGSTVHVNLGRQWNTEEDPASGLPASKAHVAYWNAAFEHKVAEAWDVGVELYGTQHSKPWTGVGVRYTPSAEWSFNAIVSRQPSPSSVTTWSAGFKYSF